MEVLSTGPVPQSSILQMASGDALGRDAGPGATIRRV